MEREQGYASQMSSVVTESASRRKRLLKICLHKFWSTVTLVALLGAFGPDFMAGSMWCGVDAGKKERTDGEYGVSIVPLKAGSQ